MSVLTVDLHKYLICSTLPILHMMFVTFKELVLLSCLRDLSSTYWQTFCCYLQFKISGDTWD
jgi:hypothetical protein